MPTSFGTYNPGDVIQDTHVEAFNSPINNLETGASFYGVDGGGTDAYAATLSPVPASYTAGMMVHFKANTANTGAATLNVNGLGARAIKKQGGVDLATGDIAAGQVQTVIYDGTNFQVIGAERSLLRQSLNAGRLEFSSASQLRLNAFAGQYLDVNEEAILLDGSTAACQLAPTENLINSTGGDAGAAMTASTTYYVYRSNSGATTFPNDLRASSTAPADYRGDKYLAASGNGANWRFVGMVRTNASTQFTDNLLTISWLNRRLRRQLSKETTDSWTYTTASWRGANNGASVWKVDFLSNGVDLVRSVAFIGALQTSGGSRFAIGLDSASSPAADSLFGFCFSTAVACPMTATYSGTPSIGNHYLQALEYGATGANFYGDASGNVIQSGILVELMG